MIGDQADFVGRLKATLPVAWFPKESNLSGTLSPVLTALLSGPASSLSWIYNLLAYTKGQTRLQSSTDVWIDVFALDFFGGALPRKVGEIDAAYIARIQRNLFAPKNTRAAVEQVLFDLTGNVPQIFEPGNTGDTGGYGGVITVNSSNDPWLNVFSSDFGPQGTINSSNFTWTGLAYNYAGGYGSLQLPFQAFIIIERPVSQGIANIGGYYTGNGWAGGGYGVGAIEYVSPALISNQVTDADIYAAVAATAPEATIMWVRIVGGTTVTGVNVLYDEAGNIMRDELGNVLVGA